jgi:hypothetical protein
VSNRQLLMLTNAINIYTKDKIGGIEAEVASSLKLYIADKHTVIGMYETKYKLLHLN